MEPQIILSGLTTGELRQLIVDVFKEMNELKNVAQVLAVSKSSYLSRKEVSKILQISLPTLRQYVKNGIIVSYRIGRRVLFKANEVEKALTEVKLHKYKKSA